MNYTFETVPMPENLMNTITEEISFIKSTENPLSADVVFIKKNGCTWIYDAGSSKESLEAINRISGKKNIVLSHFHPDHSENLLKAEYDNLYLGENSAKYFSGGIVVKEKCEFDGIEIMPIVSSHAKGCLILKCGEYVFLGDATYAVEKQEKRCYNAQKLLDEIRFLKSLDAKYFCLSHDRRFVRPKESIILLLEHVYKKRVGNEPYIWLSKSFHP